MLTPNGRWAVGAIAVLLCAGWVFGYPHFFVLAYALIAALGVAYLWLLRQPALSSFQQLAPPVVGMGEPANAVLRTTNVGARSSAALIADYRVGSEPRSVSIERLAPGSESQVTILLPTNKRGRFSVGPLTIVRTDPFGLLQRSSHEGGKTDLIVHPLVHAMSSLPTGHRREIEGSRSAIPQEGGISFHSLRDYVAGDDRRLIHWRSVARTNSLMVRKNIVTSEPKFMVVLDTASSSYRGTSFEDSVQIAASLINAGYESRYPVLFRTTSGLETEITTTGEGRTSTMRLLAGVQMADNDPGLNAVIRFGAEASGVSLGVVTGYPELKQLAGIRRVQHLFDMTTIVQLGTKADGDAVELPGVVQIEGENAQHAAERWKAVFGS